MRSILLLIWRVAATALISCFSTAVVCISDWGLVFYTAVGGGAAFDVYFDRYCDFKIVARQWCPNKACSVVGRVRS